MTAGSLPRPSSPSILRRTYRRVLLRRRAPTGRCFNGAIALLQPLFRCSSFRGNGSPSPASRESATTSPMSRVMALLPSPPAVRGGLFHPKPIVAVWISDILVLYSPPLLEVRTEVALLDRRSRTTSPRRLDHPSQLPHPSIRLDHRLLQTVGRVP